MIWVAHDVRDSVVDFAAYWSQRTGFCIGRFVSWIGLSARQFARWRLRYGKANEHNAAVLATTGWRIGRERPSSPSSAAIRWKATGAWHS